MTEDEFATAVTKGVAAIERAIGADCALSGEMMATLAARLAPDDPAPVLRAVVTTLRARVDEQRRSPSSTNN